jgi:pimeloyl-ACP methyl ester carboxylesterase
MAPTEQLHLSDGRLLDVRASGPEAGPVLLFHHGTPGSSYQMRFLVRAAHDRGFRLVTSSRPGYGESTRQAGRRVVDVVADSNAVLDFVGAQSCVVAGWSGGGPHARACAARLDRALATLVIAGVAPYDAEGVDWLAGMGQDNLDEFGAASDSESALRTYLDSEGPGLRDADARGIIEAMRSLLPPIDQRMLSDEFGEDMAALTHDALRVGIDGWLDDDLAFVADWGFELGEIRKPVAIWQGSVDLMVPFAHGGWLADHIPGATPHLEDGQGHMSILIGAMDEMLDELAENAQ